MSGSKLGLIGHAVATIGTASHWQAHPRAMGPAGATKES